MLTPASIPFIVFTVPPLLLVIVILFTRPSIRRLIGGLLGGCAFAVFHVAWDTVAHYTGWWRYPFTTEAHAPFLWYAGSVFWGAGTALSAGGFSVVSVCEDYSYSSSSLVYLARLMILRLLLLHK